MASGNESLKSRRNSFINLFANVWGKKINNAQILKERTNFPNISLALERCYKNYVRSWWTLKTWTQSFPGYVTLEKLISSSELHLSLVQNGNNPHLVMRGHWSTCNIIDTTFPHSSLPLCSLMGIQQDHQ